MSTEAIVINQRTETKLDSYLATAIAEGFCEGEGATNEQKVEAWAFLIKTRLAYSLQGWFGRTATDLIEQGLISSEGEIDWEAFDNL